MCNPEHCTFINLPTAQYKCHGNILVRWQFFFVAFTSIYTNILCLFLVWRIYIQFSSVAQSCPTLCDPVDCSTPGLPVHHQLLELTQTHFHWVGDAIQPSHPLSSPSPPALYLSQHQGLFKWVSSSHQVAKVLEFQLQHQYFQWIFRTDVEVEIPILWPPDAKNWLTSKEHDAEKDWRQEEKEMTEDEMVRWHHWLNGHESE